MMIIGIALVGISGCMASRVNLTESRKVSIERVPSAGIYFHGVYVHQEGEELVVSGEIKRRTPSVVANGGHIDIAFTTPEGKVIEKISTVYAPRVLSKRSHRGSHFNVRLPLVPPNGSTVRVAFHEFKSGESINARSFDCGKNAAIPR